MAPPHARTRSAFGTDTQYQWLRDGVCGASQKRRVGVHSSDLSWRKVTGKGRVASFTIVRRGISRAYEAPYIVALIDLDEGPRMMSSVVGTEPETVTIGDIVEVQFNQWGEDYLMPVFQKLEQI